MPPYFISCEDAPLPIFIERQLHVASCRRGQLDFTEAASYGGRYWSQLSFLYALLSPHFLISSSRLRLPARISRVNVSAFQEEDCRWRGMPSAASFILRRITAAASPPLLLAHRRHKHTSYAAPLGRRVSRRPVDTCDDILANHSTMAPRCHWPASARPLGIHSRRHICIAIVTARHSSNYRQIFSAWRQSRHAGLARTHRPLPHFARSRTFAWPIAIGRLAGQGTAAAPSRGAA